MYNILATKKKFNLQTFWGRKITFVKILILASPLEISVTNTSEKRKRKIPHKLFNDKLKYYENANLFLRPFSLIEARTTRCSHQPLAVNIIECSS